MTFEVDWQRDYWDQVAWDKDFTIPPELDSLTPFLSPSASILDYGCGYGRVVADLAARGYGQVVGVDLSPQLIQRGLQEHPHLDLRVLDGPGLPFAPEWFDAAILMGVLTCLPTDQGQLSLVVELERVLKPGGIIYMADFLINDDARNQRRYHKFAGKYANYGVFELEEGAVLRHHSLEWIRQLTSRFQQIGLRPITVSTMNGHESRAFYYLGRKSPYLSSGE